jgi:signal transduction histidine kinase
LHEETRADRGQTAAMRSLSPFRLDLLVAALALIEFQLELLLLVPRAPDRGVASLALTGLAVGLAFRRRSPLACLAIVFGCGVVLQSLYHPYTDHLALPFFTVFVAAYSLGAYAEHRQLLAGLAIGIPLAVGFSLADQETDASSYVFSVVVMTIGPVVIGRLMRDRSRLNRALRDRAAGLERRRAVEAERAVADERTRIAGELHDVVAHALSAMTVQASGARRLVDAEPARAREAFVAVEATGRDALDELRRLLGVLRRSDEELALAPQPSLRHVASLVRRAGVPVELATDGAAAELPAGVDLTAYRVVQEALAAAERGRAAHASVSVRYRDDAVELEVLDDGAGDRTLIGIRERVALHGGRLTSEPGRVRARLPLVAA